MHDYEFGFAIIKADCGWHIYWRTALYDRTCGELVWEHSRPLFRIPWRHKVKR